MKIFITRKIPQKGIELLLSEGYEVFINQYDRILSERRDPRLGNGNPESYVC